LSFLEFGLAGFQETPVPRNSSSTPEAEEMKIILPLNDGVPRLEVAHEHRNTFMNT
jgi:hypothetical protein